MRILAWRPAATRKQETKHAVPGAYAGYARYVPRHPSSVPATLRRAVGRVAQVACYGVAPDDDPFAGQVLYLEWRNDELFDGYLIPEQDLEFLPAALARELT